MLSWPVCHGDDGYEPLNEVFWFGGAISKPHVQSLMNAGLQCYEGSRVVGLTTGWVHAD